MMVFEGIRRGVVWLHPMTVAAMYKGTLMLKAMIAAVDCAWEKVIWFRANTKRGIEIANELRVGVVSADIAIGFETTVEGMAAPSGEDTRVRTEFLSMSRSFWIIITSAIPQLESIQSLV